MVKTFIVGIMAERGGGPNVMVGYYWARKGVNEVFPLPNLEIKVTS